MDTNNREWSFEKLVGFIRQVHDNLAAQAGRAVNLSLTFRNWLIGCYIAEYEQNGTDRAEYGTRLLENLSSHLSETGMDGVAPRSLRLYRQFYLIYPAIWQTPSAKSQTETKDSLQLGIPASELIQKLSFSHFAELIGVADDTKRAFYEIECIRGNWSVDINPFIGVHWRPFAVQIFDKQGASAQVQVKEKKNGKT